MKVIPLLAATAAAWALSLSATAAVDADAAVELALRLRHVGVARTHDPIDLLVIVSDCHTTWSQDVPPFPVITIRVGDGAPTRSHSE